ncbi:predicted permease, DMT superfamily [Pyrinomonas methylaliphatogenes]|jgi:drug/metabolite transporter (DMT)-like permease|uniref:Predicted permease, DMT superfamily n=1 Tax=Pyrinomonas methylaliphatogenes TaxID=454194 RepID=A0A0B6WU79_9BACT|nr:predicted permease, DMT superfamily [Pyrinomonas methylaliphatogenes]
MRAGRERELAKGRAVGSWRSPLVLIAIAAMLFSTGGLFIKLSSLSAFALSCGRCSLAAVTVAFLTRREGLSLNRIVALAALLYAALLLLFVLATKLTTAANAIFLQYTAPVYILALEPILYGERFHLSDLAVVGGCLVGMALFFVGKLAPSDWNGNLAALASGFCYALFMLLLRHPRARLINSAAPVFYGNLLLAAVTAPALLDEASALSGREILIICYLGVVQLGVAYILFTRGIARGARSLDAGIIGYIEPVLNPLWVFIFLGERPSPWALLGGAIIIAAVGWHTLRRAKRMAA